MPDRDCFREGACGTDGWNQGAYAGVTISSTGCSDTIPGEDTYNRGKALYVYVGPLASTSTVLVIVCEAN